MNTSGQSRNNSKIKLKKISPEPPWTVKAQKQDVAYLLKHGSFVHFLSGNVTHLQDAQGKGFEGWLFNQVGVMDVQTGKHSLRQRVTLQPCDLRR